MNPHLFVYGTLMSTAGHRMGRKLAREARLLGSASMQGALYHVASYPGVVETSDARDRVYGELYELADPAASFAWLDAYEGLVAGGAHDREYLRVERPAWLLNGGEVVAWAYLYRRDPGALRRIAGGRWLPAGR
jgi:gamma-glutamylcyclotransferase (GGCT)/AIG2-like uncharacterized protein YtfP